MVTFLKMDNEVIVIITGLPLNHNLSNVIIKKIQNMGYQIEAFSIKPKVNRFVPYFKLYDYKSQKWLLN